MNFSELVSRLAEFTSDGIIITEGSTCPPRGRRILWCNQAVLTLTGYDEADILGRSPRLFRGSETNHREIRRLRAGLMEGQAFRTDIRYHRKDGSAYWCELSLTPVAAPDDPCHLWLIFLRDVTERYALSERLERAQREARQHRERLWSAIEALPDGFVLYDDEDRLVLCNTRYREVYEATGSAIRIGEKFREILGRGLDNGQYPEAEGRREAWLQERMDRHLNPQGPIIQELPDNRFLKIHEVRTATGDIVGFRTDVTELQRQKQKLTEQAAALTTAMTDLEVMSRTDSLTGLVNRRGLDIAMHQLTEDCDGQDDAALLHIDLDRFKPINDVFGHAAGDFILRHVADILRNAVHDGDCVARVGGDEFVVLLNRRDDTDLLTTAQGIADRVIRECGRPVSWQDKVLHFGTCAGIAIGPVREAGRLIQDADIALYQAKDAGRNQAALFTPELRRMVEERKRLADEFLVAMDTDAIVPHYQPQILVDTRELAGLEALVRWQHPTRGVITPDVFLGIADELGLLAELDERVLDHARDFATECRNAGYGLPKLSVNVSSHRLQAMSELGMLTGLAPWPCALAFELLETIDFDNGDSHLDWILDDLRDLGIGIEIDDFGSGRASLTTLLKIRPDRLKLDRRIVQAALSHNDAASAMIRAVAEMAGGLGIAMTAEGIETERQEDLVRQLGVQIGQGYRYAKPRPAVDLDASLRSPGGEALDGFAADPLQRRDGFVLQRRIALPGQRHQGGDALQQVVERKGP